MTKIYFLIIFTNLIFSANKLNLKEERSIRGSDLYVIEDTSGNYVIYDIEFDEFEETLNIITHKKDNNKEIKISRECSISRYSFYRNGNFVIVD